MPLLRHRPGIAERAGREAIWYERYPHRFHGYCLETHPHLRTVETVRAWMASQPCESGENLVILGPVSTGKTGLAIGAMWEMAIDHDIAGRFVTTPSFLDDLRPRQQVDGMTRRLAKTDRRRVYLTLQVLTVDEAMPFVGAVVDAVKRYVTDQDVLSRSSADLTRLADHGLGEHAGDSLLIEISMSPAPACPTSE